MKEPFLPADKAPFDEIGRWLSAFPSTLHRAVRGQTTTPVTPRDVAEGLRYLADRLELAQKNAGLECSICRQVHGREVEHACE